MRLRLFTPISLVHGLAGGKHMTIVWFCPERPEPLGSYVHLIRDYNVGSPIEQRWQERALDNHLTESEAGELQDYLKDTEYPIRVLQKVPLPIGRAIGHISAHEMGKSDNIIQLTDRPGYSLSVPIWGSTFIEDCVGWEACVHGVFTSARSKGNRRSVDEFFRQATQEKE